MPRFRFLQPIYYYYEVEAENVKEAYAKTAEINPGDEIDEVVGSWELVDEDDEWEWDTTKGDQNENLSTD